MQFSYEYLLDFIIYSEMLANECSKKHRSFKLKKHFFRLLKFQLFIFLSNSVNLTLVHLYHATSVLTSMYYVAQEKRLKELFNSIPTLEELHELGAESAMADIILVDTRKDKKLWMLKQWTLSLVKGMNSNPAAMIKKIAGLVSAFGDTNYTFPSLIFILFISPN